MIYFDNKQKTVKIFKQRTMFKMNPELFQFLESLHMFLSIMSATLYSGYEL